MKNWQKIALAAVGGIVLWSVILRTPSGGDTETPATEKQDTTSANNRAAWIDETPDLIRDFDARKYMGKPADVVAGAYALEALAERVKIAEAQNNPDAKAWADALKRKQAKVFPELRRAWVAAMDATLWEKNIDAETEGSAAAVVRFTGGAFASNKAVADAQESISEQVQRLRFKKVKYLWIPSASEYQLYTIESKADRDL